MFALMVSQASCLVAFKKSQKQKTPQARCSGYYKMLAAPKISPL